MFLTEEQELLQQTVRDFAQNEVKPRAAKFDEQEFIDPDVLQMMGELGLMGIIFPEQYGGAGMDSLSYILAVEELSRVCASTGITLASHISLGVNPIYVFGTEEQKKKYLPPMCSGQALGSFGLTEPNAGSDAGGTETTAVRDNGQWVINGSKMFITNGSWAKTAVITAMTDRSKGIKGISAFIMEKDTPGFSVGKKIHKMGIRGSDTTELIFENCRIPEGNLLGKENEGFRQFMTILDGGRISIGAMALGIAQGAYDEALKYSKERQQFGQPISNFQAIQFALADMATEIEAARHLVYHAARLKDAGKSYATQAAMAKLYASETATRTCIKAIQIHGGYGYTKEYPVERMFRDVKVTEIGEGTSEIQRIVIARNLLK
ncbi:MAG: acyl-CoA dehydrogenase [Candidatus Zixiibacteriota bacterium]|nr:MAG: acyl-CoA dehydrogenase [candidate division Zixibacteria bacterium]